MKLLLVCSTNVIYDCFRLVAYHVFSIICYTGAINSFLHVNYEMFVVFIELIDFLIQT